MEGALGVEAATLNRVVEEASWSAQVNSRRLPHASETGVTTATGRCIGSDAVVPERRHGASEIGSVSGKGSSSSKRRGGSASEAE